jgi:DNA primase
MFKSQDIQKIKEAIDLADLIGDDIILKKSGKNYTGDCPFCQKKKKLNIIGKDNYYRCVVCEKSGDTIKWMMDFHKFDYPEALKSLAARANITFIDDRKVSNAMKGMSFRDQQLIASGIDVKSQISMTKEGIEIDRYEAATEIQGRIVPGNDMILHYLDLQRRPVMFYGPTGTSKNGVKFYRIRYESALRDQKYDNKGNISKYRSPKGGGNHLWIPEFILRCYEIGAQFNDLVIVEGEKKADKLCIEGMHAVGIAGIHNFSTTSDMPNEFRLLIQKCGIKRVVFMLDADCMDISIKPDISLDQRPKTFANATFKFYEYFDGYRDTGIELKCFLVWHKDKLRKGVDDLLTYEHQIGAKTIIDDLTKSMNDVKHNSEIWNVKRINDFSANKIQEIFHVNNTQDFLEFYKEQITSSGLQQFKLKGQWYSVNDDNTIEQLNKMRDWEIYWKIETVNKNGKEFNVYKFYNRGFQRFLKSHGYGRLKLPQFSSSSATIQKFVKVDKNLVREVTNDDIREFVMDYTEDISFLNYAEREDILEMMIRGSVQYFSEAILKNIKEIDSQFYYPRPDEQLLIFQTKYWKITADEITEHKLEELPGAFWIGKQIKWEVKLIPDALNIKQENGKFKLEVSEPIRKSDMFRYLWNTSNFQWRDEFKEIKDPETGLIQYEKIKEIEDPDRRQNIIDNVVPKLIAMGYVSTDYINYANLKAVVAMDHAESEVGKSKGRTGKSIFGQQFTFWKPTHRIDGKKRDLENDSFLYDGMDHSTELIFFDDCRVNMDFETFFSQITGGITVNSKNVKKQNITPRKMLFTTNHSLSGRDDSSKARQYLLTFSDYYNLHRTPYTEFNRQMFVEWEGEDYNLYFNIMAKAIQANLKYGLAYTIPGGDVIRRSQRQQIGEEFLDWAYTFFNEEDTSLERNLGKKLEILKVLEDFYSYYPKQRNFVTLKHFREKLKLYCDYRPGYIFNPQANKDGRIRSGSIEYIIIQPGDMEIIDTQSTKLPF